MDAVLSCLQLSNGHFTAFDDKLDVLSRNLMVPRDRESIFRLPPDSNHIAIIDLLPPLFSVFARNSYQFEHAWPLRCDSALTEFPRCVGCLNYSTFALNRN